MATSGIVGAVAGLWRFPVKSMRGELLEQAEFTELGLVGDRAYALIDADTGKELWTYIVEKPAKAPAPHVGDENPGQPVVIRSHPETAAGLRSGHLTDADLRGGERCRRWRAVAGPGVAINLLVHRHHGSRVPAMHRPLPPGNPALHCR